jgi:hypothetical protein
MTNRYVAYDGKIFDRETPGTHAPFGSQEMAQSNADDLNDGGYDSWWWVENEEDDVPPWDLGETVKQPTPEPVDMVNHPPHYTAGKYEVIDVLEEFFPYNPLLWQVGKYTMRAGKKGDVVEDLKKAEFYLKREIARLSS